MKTFYDIHFHAFDLSHPNLLSFITREGLLDSKVLSEKIVENVSTKYSILYSIFKPIAKKQLTNKIADILKEKIDEFLPKISNFLSIMENPIEYQFLILEYFLKKGKEAIVSNDNIFTIENEAYNKIVLCPLLMDFGHKNIKNKNVYYNIVPQKPIFKQVEDVLNAISKYYKYDLVETPEKEVKLVDRTEEHKLLEIYPFLGINTQNYTLEEILSLFEKYFPDYENDSTESRKSKLKSNLGLFDGNLGNDKLPYFFAGIKVYPPLGFDPWPDDENEREKVKLLYSSAITKKLPIITHCSGGGFNAVGTREQAQMLTNPILGWSKVLSQEEFYGLKLDFAHFGDLKNDKEPDYSWRDKIVELIDQHENVYTDISCCEGETSYFKELNKLIDKSESKLKRRILYGSDFSVNLLANKKEISYNGYMKKFIENNNGSSKHSMCTENPERFLFEIK